MSMCTTPATFVQLLPSDRGHSPVRKDSILFFELGIPRIFLRRCLDHGVRKKDARYALERL
jgi:hypothetical protein